MSLYLVARQVTVYTLLPNTQSHRTMPVNIYVSTPASQCVRIHVSTNVSFENLFWVQILVSSISIVASADHSSQCSQVGKDVAGNRPKKWQSTCQYRHWSPVVTKQFFYVHICHDFTWRRSAPPLSFLCDGTLLTCFHPPGSLCWRWTLCHLRPPEQAAKWVNGLGLIALI